MNARGPSAPVVRIRVLEIPLAICRLAPEADVFSRGRFSPFWSITRTPEEFSLICPPWLAPDECLAIDDGWIALAVVGPLDFGLTGILASLAVPLAAHAISIFAMSTYDTDIILVRENELDRAIDVLESAGHTVIRSSAE